MRQATGADVALNAAGMVRAGLPRGVSGVQTAYDVFLVAPLGIGVADQSAGGEPVAAYLTGREIKNCLEFFLPGNPNLPGQYYPRFSGMRFRYDLSRPKFDAVTQIELGDLDRGYRAIDISETGKDLYSVACNLYLGIIVASIPKKTNGALALDPEKEGRRPAAVSHRRAARHAIRSLSAPPRGALDGGEAIHGPDGATLEIKEWQAIINYMKSLPTKNAHGVTVLEMDQRMGENGSVKTSSQFSQAWQLRCASRSSQTNHLPMHATQGPAAEAAALTDRKGADIFLFRNLGLC